MEETINKTVERVGDALRIRKLEEEIKAKDAYNAQLKKQLDEVTDREFDALLRASLADPDAFFKRIKEKKIRMPTAGGNVDVDAAKMALILHKHGVLGSVQFDIETLTAAKFGRANFAGENWVQELASEVEPMQYDNSKTKAIEEAFICTAETEHPCGSLLVAEEAERRRDAAEKRRIEIYDELAALIAGVEKGLDNARNEYFRSASSTLRGVDRKVRKFFTNIKNEIEIAPSELQSAGPLGEERINDGNVGMSGIVRANEHEAGGKKKKRRNGERNADNRKAQQCD